jgi:hypothetical protein
LKTRGEQIIVVCDATTRTREKSESYFIWPTTSATKMSHSSFVVDLM